MIDPTGLFPKGFHPSQPELTADAKSKVKYIRRSDLKALPRYYFIDFGISSWFHPEERERLVLGTFGLDRDAPELSNEVPYDPFKLDVFVLGNMFREVFTSVGPTSFGVVFELTAPLATQQP